MFTTIYHWIMSVDVYPEQTAAHIFHKVMDWNTGSTKQLNSVLKCFIPKIIQRFVTFLHTVSSIKDVPSDASSNGCLLPLVCPPRQRWATLKLHKIIQFQIFTTTPWEIHQRERRREKIDAKSDFQFGFWGEIYENFLIFHIFSFNLFEPLLLNDLLTVMIGFDSRLLRPLLP